MPLSEFRVLDSSSYEALVDTHYSRVLRLCRALLRDYHEAQEVAQETFLKLHAHYPHGEMLDWGAWLTRVAVNAVRDRQRAGWWPRWRRQTEPLDDTRFVTEGPLPDAAAEASQSCERIREAFADLPRRQREVFALRQLAGLSTGETATALQVSEGSVKRHLFRAIETLRRALIDRDGRSSQLLST